MAKKALRRMVIVGEVTAEKVHQMQRNFEDAVDPIIKSEIIDGVILEDISLSAGNNTISHTLDRVILGWLVIDVNAAVDIYKVSSDTQEIVLNSSGTATINLWVF